MEHENDKTPKSISIMLKIFYVFIVFFIIGFTYYFYTDFYDIYLIEKDVTIDTGNSYQIELLPKNSKYFDYNNYVFEVDDPSIVSVNNEGEITSLNEGNAKVSVRFKKGIEKKTLNVNVKGVNVKDIDLEKNFEVYVNDSRKIKIKINNIDNVSTNVVYTSSDESIVKVDKFGNVTGIKEGKATITVTSANGVKKTATVTVKSSLEKIQEINIKEQDIILSKNEKKQLSVYTVPSNASMKGLKWNSSNEEVAEVDSNGLVTAVSNGYATISVTTKEGLNAQTTIQVKENTELVLNKYNIELEVGSSDVITSSIKAKFISSNTSIATVDNNGKVTGIKEGKTTIKVISDNGKTNTCEVVVRGKVISIEKIQFNKNNITLSIGEKQKLSYTISPSNATNRNVSWSTSDSSVLSVSKDGTIHALKEGTSTITIRTSNGMQDTCFVEVKPVIATKIEIDRSNVDLEVGSSITLNVKFTPSNTTNKKIIWSSSNTSIAEINEKGQVTAKKVGSVTITAKSTNGKEAKVIVNVKKGSTSITSIKLNKVYVSLVSGSSITLKATITPTTAPNKTIEWSSINESIATVNSKGLVKALKAGKTIITAKTSNGKTAKCTIEVNPVLPTGIKLNMTTAIINAGSSVTLKATVLPNNTTNKTVTWKSKNESIATVSSKGEVLGIKEGTTTIVARTTNDKTVECKVTVKKVEVKSIVLSKNEFNLTEGDSSTLSYTIDPTNATNKSVSFTSSNTSIVTVDSKGKIIAKKAGTAKIIVTSNSNKSVKSEALITVKEKIINVTSVSLNTTNTSVYIGDKIELKATIMPSEATNKKVTWKSSNNSIATVDQNGKVTGVKEGKVQITATSNNNKSASATINVKKKTIDVTSISIDSNVSSMEVGDTITLSATITPSNATNKKVTWSSNNTAIATVDSNGVVSAKKAGSVKITVVSNSNNNVSSSKTIVVKEKTIPVTRIYTKVSKYTLKYKESISWTIYFEPENATNKQLIYTSSDTTIAIVDSTGKITAKEKKGVATITAKSKENNSLTTSIAITVGGEPLNITTGLTKQKSYSGVSYYEVIPPHPTTDMPLIVYICPSSISTTNASAPLQFIANKKAYGKEEFFFVHTYSSQGLSHSNVKQLIDKLVSDYKIDKSRISIAGFSMGSFNTWGMVNAYPNFFSAAVPISNGPYLAQEYNQNNVQPKNFLTTKIWGHAGDKDGQANGWEAYSYSQIKKFVDKINAEGGSAKATQHSNCNHYSMMYAFSNTEIINWMLSQKNPNVK